MVRIPGHRPRRRHPLPARIAAVAALGAVLVGIPVAASRLATRTPSADGTGATRLAAPTGAPATTPDKPDAPLAAAAATPTGRASTTQDSARAVLPVHRTMLPGSAGASEPSILVDPRGAVYVTAPTGVGTTPASPLWKSVDGGTSFDGPVDPPNAATQDLGLGGGDSDLMLDSHGDLFLTSLWLGNTSTAVSPDGGVTWTAVPWGHVSPADDRPWFAYDPPSDSLYMAWDGFDGIHVGKAPLGPLTAGTPLQGTGALVFAQDVVAVPESALLPDQLADTDVRNCVCPPGHIAVDPDGNIWLAFSRQTGDTHGGVGIAESSNGGLTWTLSSIPGTGAAGDPQSADNAFIDLASDSAGNLYAAWSQSDAAATTQRVELAVLPHGGSTWRGPVPVSGSDDAVMPAMAVVAPGIVEIAYYDAAGFSGYSETAPATTRWDLVMARSDDALSQARFDSATVDQGIHFGTISVSGIGGSVDRTLGDFFSLALLPDGNACITSIAQNSAPAGIAVYCQTGPPQSPQSADAGDAGSATQAQPFAFPIIRAPLFTAPQAQPQQPNAPANPPAATSAPTTPGPASDTDLANLPRAEPRLLGPARATSSGVGDAALTSGGLFLLLSLAGLLVRGLRTH